MKKLVLMLAVVFSVSMFSCGGGESTEAADTTAVDSVEAVEEVAEVPADTVAADTVVAAEEVVAE